MWSVSIFGFFGTFLLFILLGKLCKKILKEAKKNNNYLYYVANYYIFLQMISFPIGNFIRVSSANMLVIIVLTLMLYRKKNNRSNVG